MTGGSPDARLRRLVDDGVTPDACGLLPAHAALVDALIARHGTLVLARRAIDIDLRRAMPDSRDVVVDGRDIGTAVFPDAQNAVRASKVVEAWHHPARPELEAAFNERTACG